MSHQAYFLGPLSGDSLFYSVNLLSGVDPQAVKALVFYFHGIDESIDTPGALKFSNFLSDNQFAMVGIGILLTILINKSKHNRYIINYINK